METETEEVVEEEMAEEEEEKKYADVEDWEGMEKRIQNLEDAVADLKESKEGGDDDVEEMTEEVAEPSVNPKSIKTTEVKEFSIEELKEENEKLKTELAESPAEAPLNTNKFSSERATPSKQDFKRMTKQEKFLYELYK
jgi:predicted RNase H-like nuclease (RuvC/YqgF family)